MSTSTHPSSTANTTGGRDKLAALHEQISDGVAALVESDGWRAMLDTAAKFHSYRGGGVGIFESGLSISLPPCRWLTQGLLRPARVGLRAAGRGYRAWFVVP